MRGIMHDIIGGGRYESDSLQNWQSVILVHWLYPAPMKQRYRARSQYPTTEL